MDPVDAAAEAFVAGPDRAGEGRSADTPHLAIAGFDGPLAQLLTLARAQQIDLARIPLGELVDQLIAAMHAARETPLGQKGDWVVMAAWLVLLRSRLLLPPGSEPQQDAEQAAGQLRGRLLDLAAAQALASWLDARPQLGFDVFPRGRPEVLGTCLEPAHQADVVEFLWASMALFDDGARDADTGVVYRPPWHDLHRPLEARQRILAMLASLPDGATLDRFLPAAETEEPISAHGALRRRSAWASTLLAGLELAREGDIALIQEGAFAPIHLRQADAEAMATLERTDAAALATG